MQTKRIRLLLEDLPNFLNFPLVDCSNVSTKSKLHLQPMTTRLFLSPKPFPFGHCFNQWDLFFSVYINQFGSISTSFWRYPLKSVRRKALGWIFYFTPSSSSVPPNVFSNDNFAVLNQTCIMKQQFTAALTKWAYKSITATNAAF